MNLEDHFGLTPALFPRTAGEAALFSHGGLQKVLTRLRFALDRDSISMLVAESGCGKTTALSAFARSLDAANYHILSTAMTTLAPFGLIASLSALMGLKSRRFKGETAACLLAHLKSLPKRTVLLIDEAHLLPDDSLEDLRLLTVDDFDRRSPFALVLVGQPCLRDRIAEARHWALDQRIGTRIRLRPLNESEVAIFLDRHLKAAGAQRNPLAPEATTAIFHYSRGIPRLIQNIALNALLLAASTGNKIVDEACVQQAIVDMEEA